MWPDMSPVSSEAVGGCFGHANRARVKKEAGDTVASRDSQQRCICWMRFFSEAQCLEIPLQSYEVSFVVINFAFFRLELFV